MNRRELLTKATAGLVAAGLAEPVFLDAVEAPLDPKCALAVLRVDRIISQAQRENIARAWQQIVAGTHWEPVRLMVLDRDMTFEVHDATQFEI